MRKVNENKLKKIFSGCTIVGIVIIIASLLLKETVEQFRLPVILSSVMSIAGDMMNLIGTALVIGSIFDFVRNTRDFTDIIKESLIEIVQDKQFLTNLSDDEKRRDIVRIIGGTETAHTDIKKYIDNSIEEILNIYKKPYRTNTIYDFEAKIVDAKIQFKGTISYNLHKNRNGYFDPIISIYENSDSKTVGVYVIVRGKRNKLKMNFRNENGKFIYETIVPDEFQKYNDLEIEQHIVDVYREQQANFYARVFAPVYGFKMSLKCLDKKLEIVDSFIFGDDADFDKVLDKTSNKIIIKSIEWVDEWHGIVILIARRKK